jgi:hypothetical protein
MRMLYRFSDNHSGESSTGSHDATLLAVRNWPWDVESRASGMLSSRTSVPRSIQLVRRFAATAIAKKRLFGFDMKPGYGFVVDYNDFAPGTDTHLLEHDVFVDLNTTIGKKTFVTARVQMDRESRKEFARPGLDLPDELTGERVKTDKRLSLSGASQAISWVALNWALEKNRGTSGGKGRFAASDTDDIFLRGKGTFKEVKRIALTAEASIARSLTIEIKKFQLGHSSNFKSIGGRLTTALDVEKRMLKLDPQTQVRDKNTYGFRALFGFQIGKVTVRSEFEYQRVKDFRRDSDTNVSIFSFSLQRALSGSL